MKNANEDMNKPIHVCSNNHYFYVSKNDENTACPFCNEKSIRMVEYRAGDCIACGNLCPEYAYGCTDSKPLKI